MLHVGGGRLLNIFWILFCFQASARRWRSWRDQSASRWLILPMSGLLRWVSIQQNIFSSCWWQCPSCFLLLMLFWRKTAAHFLQAAHCISNMQDELSTNVGDAFLRNVWWMMTHQKKWQYQHFTVFPFQPISLNFLSMAIQQFSKDFCW